MNNSTSYHKTTENSLQPVSYTHLIDYKATWLNNLLKEIRSARFDRAKKMIEKLNGLGIFISLDEVLELSLIHI